MSQDEITIYQTVDGNMVLNVKAEKGCVWLTQKHIFELFEVKRPAITKHLKNIFMFGELNEKSTCSLVEHIGGKVLGGGDSMVLFNLGIILAIGYRVNSKNVTQFRISTNYVLKVIANLPMP